MKREGREKRRGGCREISKMFCMCSTHTDAAAGQPPAPQPAKIL